MSIDETIEILQAAKAGRTIQILRNGQWRDETDFIDSLGRIAYRIKPEPREWMVHEALGHINSYGSAVPESKLIKVREVLE